MSAERIERWGNAQQWLQVGSALAAVAFVALVLYRSGVAELPLPATHTSVYVAVEQAEVSAGSVSETESEGTGYIMVVETTPEGAEVWLNGESKGTSPSSLNLECEAGSTLRLELREKGYTTLKRAMTCKPDTMVVVRATLEKK